MSAIHLFRVIPCASWFSSRNIYFPGISRSSRDNKSHQSTEERLLLNLTTQPCFKLLGDDPYKAVSVVQRRCSKWCPCLGNSLWSHMLRGLTEQPHLGGNELIPSLCQFFFCPMWAVEKWHSTASLSRSGCSIGHSICPAVCGYKPINTEICSLSVIAVALTHQGAVVHQSRGEVAGEAKWQDVSFSGAESHFIFWQG